ncbi:exocyst complex component EXO70C1-like [Rutidosis leptorrhynchoides]|uniref:exocyst complex component EXO70C1-like n=1 Tax=Rutidosis leptorrhynchoides TaxID=125765 RepID=UPI003A993191
MDKHSYKSGSFIGRHRWRTNLDTFSPRLHHKSPIVPDPHSESSDEIPDEIPDDIDHDRILIELDAFNDELSLIDDKSTSPELPNVFSTFSIIIKSKTRKSLARNVDITTNEDDSFIYESITRLCNIKTALNDYPKASSFDAIIELLNRIMKFMEERLRFLLMNNNLSSYKEPPEPKLKVISSKHFSFKTERCPVPEPSKEEEDYPGYDENRINKMTKTVTTMINAGYKNECTNVYCMSRGNAMYEQLRKLDFERLNADDVHKLYWELLEADMSRWIRVINNCSKFLIPAERTLGETVFSDHPLVFNGLFVNLVRSVITSLLDYAAAVAMTRRSAERLFKFLDMYEALRGLNESLKSNDSHDVSKEDEAELSNDLNTEIVSVSERIGEGAVNMFVDLETSIRNDAAKTPVPGGAVHPLTRYVLNYLNYACEYGDSLEQIFQQNAKLNELSTTSEEEIEMEKSPLAIQIMSVMSLLDGNLAVKSTLYKDLSLRNIFLMNNGRYILQKVKGSNGSNEIKKLMGDNWCRRRSTEVRNYHKSYQRETWARLLQCITQEGIQINNGKVNKKVLKERFKNFNNMFEEIHKTQSTWVVSEEQLLSELRASIAAVVIPAYRSFVGRYKHQFEAGKSMDKYIKYQPEDIEALIETLFEGNPPSSMSRKRF